MIPTLHCLLGNQIITKRKYFTISHRRYMLDIFYRCFCTSTSLLSSIQSRKSHNSLDAWSLLCSLLPFLNNQLAQLNNIINFTFYYIISALTCNASHPIMIVVHHTSSTKPAHIPAIGFNVSLMIKESQWSYSRVIMGTFNCDFQTLTDEMVPEKQKL